MPDGDPIARPSASRPDGRRALPPVQQVIDHPALDPVRSRFAAAFVRAAVRDVLESARQDLGQASAAVAPTAAALAQRTADQLMASVQGGLARVVNATGIVLHTNLGRAPLAGEAIEAMAAAAGGYCDLEYDLDAGRRGPRGGATEALLVSLTGAEAALVVNNNAAAVLLALSALAGDGEAIVSRGELVEIGGGFRIPDVVRQGGARLVEVGTTNRTHPADYAQAITPQTRVILKVHPSNFRMSGFTSEVGLAELSALAKAQSLLVVQDLGSGAMSALGAEAMVADSVAAGADVVTFSGDKLLGGPQAGVIVGRALAVDRMRRHPLMRALRADKLCIAALEATLKLYLAGVADRIPVARMLGQPRSALLARGQALLNAIADLAGVEAEIVVSSGYAGGGAMAELAIESVAVALRPASMSAESLARRLRAGRPAVVGRILEDRLLLDLLTISDEETPVVIAALRTAIGAPVPAES